MSGWCGNRRRGPSLTVTQTVGAAASGGSGALLGRPTPGRPGGHRRRPGQPPAGRARRLRLRGVRRPLHGDAGAWARAVGHRPRVPARVAARTCAQRSGVVRGRAPGDPQGARRRPRHRNRGAIIHHRGIAAPDRSAGRMRCVLCSTSRMSIRLGSTTCPPVSPSPRPHRSWRRYARLISPNWTASSRRAGSGVTEGDPTGTPAAVVKLSTTTVATEHFSPSLRAGREPALSRPPLSDSATHAPSANGTAELLLRSSRRGSDTARVSTHIGGPPPVAVATHAPAIWPGSVQELPPARIRWHRVPEPTAAAPHTRSGLTQPSPRFTTSATSREGGPFQCRPGVTLPADSEAARPCGGPRQPKTVLDPPAPRKDHARQPRRYRYGRCHRRRIFGRT